MHVRPDKRSEQVVVGIYFRLGAGVIVFTQHTGNERRRSHRLELSARGWHRSLIWSQACRYPINQLGGSKVDKNKNEKKKNLPATNQSNNSFEPHRSLPQVPTKGGP